MKPLHSLPLFGFADGDTDAARAPLAQVLAPPIYPPIGVGFKVEGPSREAAEAIAPKVTGLRLDVLKSLNTAGERRGPSFPGMSSDELAAAMGKTPFSIRPRFSELARFGFIEETGARGQSTMGCSAARWRVTEAGRLYLRTTGAAP